MGVKDVINLPFRSELTFPNQETSENIDDTTRRAEKEERSKSALHAYNKELRNRRAEDNAKYNGLHIGDIDKKLKSQLYLPLGKEGQKCFAHKNPGKRILVTFQSY